MAKKPKPLVGLALEPATDEPLVVSLGQVEVNHVEQDGTTVLKNVNLYVDSAEKLFKIELPFYVPSAQRFVRDSSAADTIDAYEEACERYASMRLAGMGKPAILVSISAYSELLPKVSTSLVLSFTRVVSFEDNNGDVQDFVLNDDLSYGRFFSYRASHVIRLPDMKEIFDKLVELYASIETAKRLLCDFSEAADPVATLMAIKNWETAPVADAAPAEATPVAVEPVEPASVSTEETAASLALPMEPSDAQVPPVDDDEL